MVINKDARILILDIETKPITAYVWKLWDQNVGLNQIVDNGGIICVGLKFLGDREKFIYSDWEHGHEEMLKQVWLAINAADAVVTYNGDAFDLKKLQGEFLLNGFGPTPPITSIDCLKAVKKLGFISNRLAFIGPLLKVGSKIKHEGMELWVKVMAGDHKAQVKMEKYCLQDVLLLEKVYLKIRPYIRNHPHLGTTKGIACGACGSNHVQSRGYRRTKAFRIQRIQCQKCGSWSDGVRTKIG
jgi:hypothetical protein